MSGHGFLLLLVGLFWISVSLAVGADAVRRGRQGGVWGVTVFLLGPFGILLYVLVLLGGMAAGESDDSDTDGGATVRVCPACGTVHTGSPDRCEECGETLEPGDEPRSARLVRSGSRGYCGECRSRVALDSEVCPNCGSAF